MERYLMISDAAKEVQVESHVLRYWEEELHLPIRRNELGHRYYTEGDVELFKQIKSMKERGLQLKAIKMILKDGKLDVMLPEEERLEPEGLSEEGIITKESNDTMAIQVVSNREESTLIKQSDVDMQDEKAKRLQWLLQQLFRETLQENNKELCQEIKESVVKELDYQFRTLEEREEERDRIREQRDEAHYKKLDELLRKKVKKEKPEERHESTEQNCVPKDSKESATKVMTNVLSMDQASKQKKKRSGGKKKFRIFSVEN